MPCNAFRSSFNLSSLPFNASLPPVMHPVKLEQILVALLRLHHCILTFLHHSFTLSHHHLTHPHHHLTLPRRPLMLFNTHFNTPVAFQCLLTPIYRPLTLFTRSFQRLSVAMPSHRCQTPLHRPLKPL